LDPDLARDAISRLSGAVAGKSLGLLNMCFYKTVKSNGLTGLALSKRICGREYDHTGNEDDADRLLSKQCSDVPSAVTLSRDTPPRLRPSAWEVLAWIIHDFASEKRKGALKD